MDGESGEPGPQDKEAPRLVLKYLQTIYSNWYHSKDLKNHRKDNAGLMRQGTKFITMFYFTK